MTEKAPQTQAQTASAEKDWKKRNAPDENGGEAQPKDDEPIYFDTTIAKLVKRENENGDEEWVEVLSDNLYPGERLKRDVEEEKAKKKAEKDKADSEKADADKDKK